MIGIYSEVESGIYMPKGKDTELTDIPGTESFFKYEGFTPREEQAKVLEFCKATRAGLIEMKTAKGKTLLAAMLINQFQCKTLIVVHSLSIVPEVVETLEKKSLNFTPGIYCDGKKELRDITITSHKSFKEKIGVFIEYGFNMVLFDECDINISKNNKKFDMIDAICQFPCGRFYGLTGTPNREDIGLDGMTTLFGQHIKVEEQENNGYNFIPNITQVYYKLSDELCEFEDWNDFKLNLYHSKDRIDAQVDLIKKSLEKGVITHAAVLIEDKKFGANILYERLLLEGFADYVGLMTGDTKTKNDVMTVNQLNSSKTGLLIGTSQKIGRGKDIPILNGVFIFSKIKAPGTTIQQIGRGLRFGPDGKAECEVIDRVDFPITKKQAEARKKTYLNEYPGVRVKQHRI